MPTMNDNVTKLSPAQSKMVVWGFIGLVFLLMFFGNCHSCGGYHSGYHSYHRGYHSGGGFHFGK